MIFIDDDFSETGTYYNTYISYINNKELIFTKIIGQEVDKSIHSLENSYKNVTQLDWTSKDIAQDLAIALKNTQKNIAAINLSQIDLYELDAKDLLEILDAIPEWVKSIRLGNRLFQNKNDEEINRIQSKLKKSGKFYILSDEGYTNYINALLPFIQAIDEKIPTDMTAEILSYAAVGIVESGENSHQFFCNQVNNTKKAITNIYEQRKIII